jgi:hypothetical protein
LDEVAGETEIPGEQKRGEDEEVLRPLFRAEQEKDGPQN